MKGSSGKQKNGVPTIKTSKGATRAKAPQKPTAAKPKPTNAASASKIQPSQLGAKTASSIKPSALGDRSPKSGQVSTSRLRNRQPENNVRKGKVTKAAPLKKQLGKLREETEKLKKSMQKEDLKRLKKAIEKPSVTDKRSKDYFGKLTKEGRKQTHLKPPSKPKKPKPPEDPPKRRRRKK
jgi:hypothetical protein